MAFPIVEATAVTNHSADQTTHVINLPASIAAGELLLLWFCVDKSAGLTVSTPAGWTLLEDVTSSSGSTERAVLFSKTASGSEGATVNITTNNSESSSALAFRLSGWTNVEQQETTEHASALLLSLTVLTPAISSQAIVFTFWLTPGNRQPTELAEGVSSLQSTADATTATVYATAVWKAEPILSGVTVTAYGGRSASATVYAGVVLAVHGGSLGGGGVNMSRVHSAH